MQNILHKNELNVERKTVEYGQYLRYEVERFIKYELLHWDAEGRIGKAIQGLKKVKRSPMMNWINCKTSIHFAIGQHLMLMLGMIMD